MTPRDIIDLWPTRPALADDLGIGVPKVAAWYRRDSIASRYFEPIVAAAARRQFDLSYEAIVKAHSCATPGQSSPKAVA